MKQFFTLIKSLVLIIFFPAFLSAQGTQDYTIQLKSGKFIPQENIISITKDADVFQKSFFTGKNYVTIQFFSLPDQEMKTRLAAAGIVLIDYIPNNAFTASVSSGFNLAEFKSFPFRSVFQFSADQKAIPEILTSKVPQYAIKIAGTADVTVVTYEKMYAVSITTALNTLGATIIEDMPLFRSFTIRIAKKNLKQLVELPFVQWVEYIAPPNQIENLPGRTLHRVSVLNDGPRNLKGDGVNVGIWDAGEISPHIDFLPSARLTQVEFNSPQSHSTHCSGTFLAGDCWIPKQGVWLPMLHFILTITMAIFKLKWQLLYLCIILLSAATLIMTGNQ